MPIPLNDCVQAVAALLLGGLIGLAFGKIQQAAWQRHQRLQAAGEFHSGWAVMPGSFRRVAFLLMALVLVQWVCPLLFTQGAHWWVSGGVLGGYGLVLWGQLRRSLARKRGSLVSSRR